MNCIQYFPQPTAGAIAMNPASLLFSLTCAGNELTLEGTRVPHDPETELQDGLTEGLEYPKMFFFFFFFSKGLVSRTGTFQKLGKDNDVWS